MAVGPQWGLRLRLRLGLPLGLNWGWVGVVLRSVGVEAKVMLRPVGVEVVAMLRLVGFMFGLCWGWLRWGLMLSLGLGQGLEIVKSIPTNISKLPSLQLKINKQIYHISPCGIGQQWDGTPGVWQTGNNSCNRGNGSQECCNEGTTCDLPNE